MQSGRRQFMLGHGAKFVLDKRVLRAAFRCPDVTALAVGLSNRAARAWMRYSEANPAGAKQ